MSRASLALTATLTVTLGATGGSFTYRYAANAVPLTLEADGTFDSTAPLEAALVVNGNGCSLDLRLVDPQIEIAGSASDDGATLRVASIRVTQDDVAGSGSCGGDRGAPDFSGIGAGSTNLSPAAPAELDFHDGSTVSVPRPAAIDRYPRSVSVEWTGTLQLAVPEH